MTILNCDVFRIISWIFPVYLMLINNYWHFLWQRVSPEVILSGWLGSKHQQTVTKGCNIRNSYFPYFYFRESNFGSLVELGKRHTSSPLDHSLTFRLVSWRQWFDYLLNDNNNKILIKREPLVYTRGRRAVQTKKKEEKKRARTVQRQSQAKSWTVHQ